MVPRSGCSRISAAGSAATASIANTSMKPTRPRQRPSLRSATTSAMPITMASFANSEGWMERPPSISHDREPLTVLPIVSTRTSPATDAA